MNGHDYGYGKSPGQQGNPQNGWAQAQNNVPWGGPTDQVLLTTTSWILSLTRAPMRDDQLQAQEEMHACLSRADVHVMRTASSASATDLCLCDLHGWINTVLPILSSAKPT